MRTPAPSMKPEASVAGQGVAILPQDRTEMQSLQLANDVQPRRDVLPLMPAGAPPTMSSREITELTGKRHGDVIRDIRVMLDALAGDDAVLRHVHEEKDARGYTAAFHLPKDLTITLVSGYSVQMRHRIVTRWMELEAQQQQPAAPALPKNFAEALRLAADQAEGRQRRRDALMAATQMLRRSPARDAVGRAMRAQPLAATPAAVAHWPCPQKKRARGGSRKHRRVAAIRAAFLCASYTHAHGSSFGGPGGGAFGHAGPCVPVFQPCQGRHPRLEARMAVCNRNTGAVTMAGSPLRTSAQSLPLPVSSRDLARYRWSPEPAVNVDPDRFVVLACLAVLFVVPVLLALEQIGGGVQ